MTTTGGLLLAAAMLLTRPISDATRAYLAKKCFDGVDLLFPGLGMEQRAVLLDQERDNPPGLDPEVVSALCQAAGERGPVEACRDRFGDGAEFAGAPSRPGGNADLTAFRVTTPDPRFDPAGPVCVNGYLYRPAKEA